MKHKQDGFAVLEGLLILIILGLIGGTGWYVWHATSQTNKTLNTASNEKLAAPKKMLEIKEWGVQLALDTDVSDAYYKLNTVNIPEFNAPSNAYVNVSQVELVLTTGNLNKISACGYPRKADYIRSKDYNYINEKASLDDKFKIGDYWYGHLIFVNNAACARSDDKSKGDQINKIISELRSSMEHAQLVTAQ